MKALYVQQTGYLFCCWSAGLSRLAEDEAKKLVEGALAAARDCVAANRRTHEGLSAELEARERLDGNALAAWLGQVTTPELSQTLKATCVCNKLPGYRPLCIDLHMYQFTRLAQCPACHALALCHLQKVQGVSKFRSLITFFHAGYRAALPARLCASGRLFGPLSPLSEVSPELLPNSPSEYHPDDGWIRDRGMQA